MRVNWFKVAYVLVEDGQQVIYHRQVLRQNVKAFMDKVVDMGGSVFKLQGNA